MDEEGFAVLDSFIDNLSFDSPVDLRDEYYLVEQGVEFDIVRVDQNKETADLSLPPLVSHPSLESFDVFFFFFFFFFFFSFFF